MTTNTNTSRPAKPAPRSSRAGFRLVTGSATAIGSKEVNEDFFAIRVPPSGLQETKGAVILIADGMSGSHSGKEAATLTVRGFLSDYFSTPETWSVSHSVSKVLASINGWLFRAQSDRDAARATTLSILILKSNTAHVFHVGDSRILRVRIGEPEVLTQTHRVVMPSGEAYLSRAVGIEPLLQVDSRRETLEVGDYFILTTDGVHDTVSALRMIDALNAYVDDLDAAADDIVQAALALDDHDNASCLVVRVDALPGAELEEFYASLTRLPFPPDLAPGMIVDGYRVTSELSASNRSQIYLVEDRETGAVAALKAPSVNFEDDPRYIDQFITEEWIGRRLKDPRVLQILEPLRPRTFLYTLMEAISGDTLRDWMEKNPNPSIEEVQNLTSALAASLNALHRREVLHRDLKPQNVMITDEGAVKIIDFGSIRVAALDEIVTPLDPNHLVGTIDYSAPEFHEGHGGSEKSDQYALGTIAYEMLTGKLPYGQSAPTSTDPRKAGYVSALHHNPLVPIWIDGALKKAVACRPEERYEAISEFIYDLTHPNPGFVNLQRPPLLERNPVAFWRFIGLASLLVNVIFLYLLLR